MLHYLRRISKQRGTTTQTPPHPVKNTSQRKIKIKLANNKYSFIFATTQHLLAHTAVACHLI
jgi:hypothetical protein